MVIYTDEDVDLAALAGRIIAVVGYGNQGRAHALNLRDSGLRVVIGQRPGGPGHEMAVADGFSPVAIAEASAQGDLLIVTLPDELAADVYEREIAPALRPGQALGFAHGFNVRFGFIRPPEGVDCVLVAPKGPGTLLRSLYVEGRGLPALVAVEQDASGHAMQTALAWAAGIGSTRSGCIATTFAAETEADLFGEQVVLCGGVTALMKAAFATLVEAGFAPEVAYIECIHELKQIVDLVYAEGLSAMRRRISNTAEYGDLTRGPRVINDECRAEMRRILDEIRSGTFAREWIAECRAGLPNLTRLFEADAHSPLESAGQAVRGLMPWLARGTGVCGTGSRGTGILPVDRPTAFQAVAKGDSPASTPQASAEEARAGSPCDESRAGSPCHDNPCHESPCHDRHVDAHSISYFDHSQVEKRKGAYLPHWLQDGAAYSVTFRLADSLPEEVVESFIREREEIVRRAAAAGRSLTVDESKRLETLYSERVEAYLDAGHGACYMNDPRIAELVQSALLFFDGQRYDLVAWAVMPNHVHAVFVPRAKFDLAQILHSWKSYTSNQANGLLNRQGSFWQPEYFDHLIRDAADFERSVRYVLDNPKRAGLTNWRWVGYGKAFGKCIQGT